MSDNIFEIQTRIQIQRPVHDVFEAIVDPANMINYFISESSGRMEQGRNLVWKFPEFEDEAPILVDFVEKDRSVKFSWEVGGRIHQVSIDFSAGENNTTLVQVRESGGENNDKGIEWLKQNTEGWANFLACLKAWLEYGINLRKGAFDFMRKKN